MMRFTLALSAAILGGLTATVMLLPDGGTSAVAAAAQPGEADVGLALVPADAAGFAHLRLADLWRHEALAEFRKTWEAAGPDILAALDKQVVPAPSTLNRATGFVVLDERTKEPRPFVVLGFSAAFDPNEVIRAYLPTADKTQIGEKTVYADKRSQVAVTFPSNRQILIGHAGAMSGYLAKAPATDGPLAPALKLAASRPVVAAVNVAALPIPPGAIEKLGLPVDLQPLLKAKLVVLSLDLGAEARIELRAGYATADAARDAENAARAAISLGRKELSRLRTDMEGRVMKPKKTPRPLDELPETFGGVFAIGALKRIDGFLADPGLIRRDGPELTAAVTVPKDLMMTGGMFSAVGVGLLLPAVQKVRVAAARTSSMNNLKQLTLAIHNYHDANGRFPSDIKDKNGKPILSWRVAILPYIEQDNVFRQFRLDEPWDGPNNKRWSQLAIRTFVSPNAAQLVSPQGWGVTSYKGVAGPGTMFDPKRDKLTFADVHDGTSNTIIFVETGDPIPWAKPGDFVVDVTKPLPAVPTTPGLEKLLLVAMADGSVRTISESVSEKTLRAMFTRAGGEVIGADR